VIFITNFIENKSYTDVRKNREFCLKVVFFSQK